MGADRERAVECECPFSDPGEAERFSPSRGVFRDADAIIDDERRQNAFGLLMSLNMLIETPGGFDYTGADFARWAKQVGFRDVSVLPLVGPTSAAVAYK